MQLLALHVALRRLVLDKRATCRWFDADGSFSPTRARAILEFMGVDVSSLVFGTAQQTLLAF